MCFFYFEWSVTLFPLLVVADVGVICFIASEVMRNIDDTTGV